jgi:MYXO-CTERM domain-containing protein
MPTQTQVDTAINFAETNSLWVTPTGATGYDNDLTTPIAPFINEWGVTYANVQSTAEWIWYDSGGDAGNPFSAVPLSGFNHDEFLVFRIAGSATVPEPSTFVLAALGLMGLLGFGRLRRKHRS